MPLPAATISYPISDSVRTRLEAAATLTMAVGVPRAQLLAALADAEGLLCNNSLPVNAELFDAAPHLRVVSGFGVGYDQVDVAEATRRGVAICNTPDVLTDCVADLTMGLILAAARKLLPNAGYVSAGRWSRREPGPGLGFDVRGKTLGLIGYGRIGRATAHRARAFGMRIIFNDLFTDPGPGDGAAYRPLMDLMAESDIVSVHTFLAAETRHLVGAGEIGAMKQTAWLVNTARGPIVDEAALAAALNEGRIAGAALDVLEVEPPPESAAILGAPNTILLPHVGSATVETRADMLELCLSNFEAVLAGRPPRACVNPEVLDRALKRG
jgi:glyoxylate reductase